MQPDVKTFSMAPMAPAHGTSGSATATMTEIELTEMASSSAVPMSVLGAAPAGTTTPPGEESQPPRGRRVFGVAPAPSSLSRALKLLTTTLIIGSNLAQFVSNFVTVGAGFTFNKDLGRPQGPGQANWMAAAYPLTQGAFVLISGRLGAIYGHQRILLLGIALLAACSLANAFCTEYVAFITLRALTGVGGGLIMPNAVALLTIMLPPGRGRNAALGFFGASAPVGGWIGALFSGLFTQYSRWQYLFVLIAALAAAIFAGLWLLLPKEHPVDKDGGLDYVGAVLGLSGLILFSVVWNQAPSAGWSTPYEIALLITSVALFGGFLAWEKWFARDPVMPMTIFRAPTFAALVFVVLLTYMSFSISLWYMIAWQQLVREWTVIQFSLGWIPFGLAAVAAVALAAWLIPRLAAQWILAIGVGAALLANLLLATMPAQQTYWAQLFPAALLGGVCPDFVYVAAQIIASNSVSRREQGVAGSLIGTLNLYGNSLGLGFAGTIESEVTKNHGGSLTGSGPADILGYRAALFFGVGIAAVGCALDFAFVRVPKDQREGWELPEDRDSAEAVEGTLA